MSVEVTSWFLEQAARQRAVPERRFLVGGSDYSARVLRWPTLHFRADRVDLGTTTLLLDNTGRSFRFFADSEAALTTSCELALGFTHPDSGPERLSLYLGRPSGVAFEAGGARLRLQLQGKTQRLTDTVLGTEAESGGVDYTTSGYYPADLAWYLVTSHGGLSPVESASNPDLDYGQWADWRDRDAVRDVRVQAYIAGEKIYRVLERLAAMDTLSIAFQGSRLRFRPVFDAYGSDVPALPADTITGLEVAVDPARLVNRIAIDAGYQPDTGRFLSTHTRVHSASRARFGERSQRLGNATVWYATAADARYLAEDRLRFRSRPAPRVAVRTPLAGGVHRAVGGVVSLSDSFFGWTALPHRITRLAVDLERGGLEFELERARRRPWQYEATVASRNLVLRDLTAVGSGVWMAPEEGLTGRRLHRTDSAGAFRPLDLYATALLTLNGSEVLLGGPPASDSVQSVLQRSSDAGSSAVTVHTRPNGIDRVYDIFEVKSGTCLASTTSGGILRSTDAGSSWSLTWTISGEHFIGRFHAPASGRVWGGTGFHDANAEGLYVWESLDEGVTWAPAHTAVASGAGPFITDGFHALADGEHLLAAFGSNIEHLRVLRSRSEAPGSVIWTAVECLASLSHVVETASGDLLAGFDEYLTLNGGLVYRSSDQGSAWAEDARLAKQGNVRLVVGAGGAVEAYLTRTSAGPRTDRYRSYDPDGTG